MILARSILREHLAPFLFGLSLIVFIFTLNLLYQVLGKITGKGLPAEVILEYFFNNTAWILALAVPMAVLVATLSAFGRLAGDGEITALRAAGVAPTRLVAPAVWAGPCWRVPYGMQPVPGSPSALHPCMHSDDSLRIGLFSFHRRPVSLIRMWH